MCLIRWQQVVFVMFFDIGDNGKKFEKMNTIRQLETAQIYILESLFSHFQLRLHSPIEMHAASVYIYIAQRRLLLRSWKIAKSVIFSSI